MTQEELAEAMKSRGFRWSQTTVYNVETGERSLRASELRELADIFHLASVSPFFEGEQVVDAEVARKHVVAARKEALDKLVQYFYTTGKELAMARDLGAYGPEPNEDDLELKVPLMDQAMLMAYAKLLGEIPNPQENVQAYLAILQGQSTERPWNTPF